jgi:hypothetical protein
VRRNAVLRRFARSRRTFAPDATAAGRDERDRRSVAAHGAAAAGRLLAVPLAALLAAAAGAVFVVLLPICGIATLAEGVARRSWRRAARGVGPRADPRALTGY